MNLKERIRTFAGLGEMLRNSLAGKKTNISGELNSLIETQHQKNPWFTPDNVKMSVSAIADTLTYDNLLKWTDKYPELERADKPVRIAVIMAGNIPLVGFHDFLSVLITGNDIIAKTSSKDEDLIRFIGRTLTSLNPEFEKKIIFAEGTISGFEAVIATGSDNTSRYFEYYFGKYPHIIRKNRNSVAIIEGNEPESQLKSLGKDIFSYFGLGCRNVSKLFVPKDYDFSVMTKHWNDFSWLANHNKYINNYDYYKAVSIMNKEKFIDTGFVLIKENTDISSPVSVLYYEEYDSVKKLRSHLNETEDKIQCITGRNYIPFGTAQLPALWDYADRTDTIDFILKKISAGIL